MDLVKSKKRVADHGEVFTPSWLVEDMLDLVDDEATRIDSRFLEPACGSGNFLVAVLRRKLATVHRKYARSEFEKRHQALLGLMCVYGIELLPDNVVECREKLLAELFNYLGSGSADEWFAAARVVVETNVIHGNALTMTTSQDAPIVFAEWAYLGKGQYQRRDFRYATLSQMSSFDSDTLFGENETADIFRPVTTYPSMSVSQVRS